MHLRAEIVRKGDVGSNPVEVLLWVWDCCGSGWISLASAGDLGSETLPAHIKVLVGIYQLL